MKLHEFAKAMREEMAVAVNDTATAIVDDITPRVPFLSGTLAGRWGRRTLAKIEDDPKVVEVGPPISYGIKYYPFTRNFGTKSRQFFGSQRELLFQPGDVYQERVAKLLEENVQKAVRRVVQ